MFNSMNQEAQNMDIPEEKDSFGGNVKETGLYPAIVDLAYVKPAASGALMFNVVFKYEDGSTTQLSECIQSGDAKGNKPYYVKDGKQIALPGFTKISAITELLMGKELAQFTDADAETKTIKLWDGKQSKEVPTDVQMVTALIGKKVQLGLHKVSTNKQAKQGNAYVDTNERRTINEVDKVFNEAGFTASELKAQAESPEWITKWAEKYGTEEIDKFKEVKGGTTKPSGGSMFNKPKEGDTAPTNSLFNKQS
jgi:hypothetical protein